LKLQIIVLNTVKFRDSSLIVNGYTNLYGRQGFLIFNIGSRSKRGNTLSQLHPLSIIEAELSSVKKGNLPVIKEFSVIYNLVNIRTGIVKNSISVFIGELIYRTLKEIEPNYELFVFLLNSIIELEQNEVNTSDFHPRFVVNYCKHLGYLPEKNLNSDSYLFDILSGGFIDPSTIGCKFFEKESSEILQKILQYNAQGSQPLILNRNARYVFISDMLKYIGYHQGVEINLKSLNVLHEVFE
jgi:DNA repair protein RecO (recombination protein O)